MNGLKLGKNALMTSILTLITVLTWIGLEVYETATKTTIPKVTQEQMLPLNPVLKTDIIEALKNNLSFSVEELNIINVSSSSSAVLGKSKKNDKN